MSVSNTQLSITCTVNIDNGPCAADFLVEKSGLSKTKIKDAMAKGAVLLKPNKGKSRRLRKASAKLKLGTTLSLAYDEALLTIKPSQANLVKDFDDYSIWNKPAGVLSQGNEFGDHCSLLRQVEIHFHPRRPVFLVHRLDREARGLLLIAHSKKAASLFSKLFQTGDIKKIYQAEVLGVPETEKGIIEKPLDGKPAKSEYRVISANEDANSSILQVTIHTGRLHQIRRHLEILGHPIMGDPRYGTGNKDPRGLQLTAVSLRFVCPVTRRKIDIHL